MHPPTHPHTYAREHEHSELLLLLFFIVVRLMLSEHLQIEAHKSAQPSVQLVAINNSSDYPTTKLVAATSFTPTKH